MVRRCSRRLGFAVFHLPPSLLRGLRGDTVTGIIKSIKPLLDPFPVLMVQQGALSTEEPARHMNFLSDLRGDLDFNPKTFGEPDPRSQTEFTLLLVRQGKKIVGALGWGGMRRC